MKNKIKIRNILEKKKKKKNQILAIFYCYFNIYLSLFLYFPYNLTINFLHLSEKNDFLAYSHNLFLFLINFYLPYNID